MINQEIEYYSPATMKANEYIMELPNNTRSMKPQSKWSLVAEGFKSWN